MPNPITTFSTKQAHLRCGISTGMIAYLRQTGVLVPSKTVKARRGLHARYTFGDLVILRAIAKLLERGVEVRRLKAGLQALQAECQGIGKDSVDTRILVTDGKDVYLRSANELARRILDGQYAFGFLVEIESLRRELNTRTPTSVDQQLNRRKGIRRTPIEKKSA